MGANFEITKARLDSLYEKYNRRHFVTPDPLQFLYQYENPFDREIVGFIASSLAYGKVNQIIKSVSGVLEKISPPFVTLRTISKERLVEKLSNFKHRFTTGREMADFLYGLKVVINDSGSLYNCFKGCLSDGDIIDAITKFVDIIKAKSGSQLPTLLPDPKRNSACKRLNLFLRWMVRDDEVDPGGWHRVGASRLIVPLDTHMHRIAREFGITNRKSANLKTAREVTDFFKRLSPEDPVKYDFSLTRFGINPNLNADDLIDGSF